MLRIFFWERRSGQWPKGRVMKSEEVKGSRGNSNGAILLILCALNQLHAGFFALAQEWDFGLCREGVRV
jgi:hypothetical protein